MRLNLTEAEIEALHAAARNVDPCMFDEMDNEKEGERLHAAWLSGCNKLGNALETIDSRKIVARHTDRKGPA